MSRRAGVLSTIALAMVTAGCAMEPTLTEAHEPAPSFNGKGGGGGKITNPKATFTFYAAGATAGISGDSRAANGTMSSVSAESTYDDGQCGVTSEIFLNRVGDATMDPVGGKVGKNTCTGHSLGARSLTVTWGDPIAGATVSPVTAGHYTNVREIAAVGSTPEARVFTLLLRNSPTCGRVRYDAVTFTDPASGAEVHGSTIRVQAVGPGEWLAESQPDAQGRHVAFCQVGGDMNSPGTLLGAYDMPLRILVKQK